MLRQALTSTSLATRRHFIGVTRTTSRVGRPFEQCQGSKRSMAAAAAVKEIYSAADANELISSKGYTYLDVRTVEEYQAGHAPSAVNVPIMVRSPAGMAMNPGFFAQVQEKFPEAGEALVVACKAGSRSTSACQLLSSKYTNLVNYKGGWDDWAAAKMPVEK